MDTSTLTGKWLPESLPWLTSLSSSFPFISVFLHFQFPTEKFWTWHKWRGRLLCFYMDTVLSKGLDADSPHLFNFSCILFYKKCWNSGANLWQHRCEHRFPQHGQHALKQGTSFFLQNSTSKRPFAMRYSPQPQQYVRAAEAVTSPVPHQILQW